MASLGRLARRLPFGVVGRSAFGVNRGVDARGLSSFHLSPKTSSSLLSRPLIEQGWEQGGQRGEWGYSNTWRTPLLAGGLLAGGLVANSLLSSRVYAEEVEKKELQEVKEEGKEGEGAASEKKEEEKKGDELYDYVIIGGGVAAYQAIKTIRQYDKVGTILCVNGEEEAPYNHTILPKGLRPCPEGEGEEEKAEEELQKSLYKNWSKDDTRGFAEKYNVVYKKDQFVLAGHQSSHRIRLTDGSLITFGKLLIATNSLPSVKFPVSDKASAHLTGFSSLEDLRDVQSFLKKSEERSLTVLGGGVKGCQLTSVLSANNNQHGLRLVQVIDGEYVLEDMLPSFLAKAATENLRDRGVNILQNHKVLFMRKDDNDESFAEDDEDDDAPRIMGVSGTVQVVMEDLTKKERVVEETGFVLASTETANTVQNTRIARSLDLEIDEERGGFVVNSQLQAVDGVYVAGDCSSYYERVLKLRRRSISFDHQFGHGFLAGHNMAYEKFNLTDEERDMMGMKYPVHFIYQPVFLSFVGENSFYSVGEIDSKRFKTVSVFDQGEEGGNKENTKFKRGVVYYLQEEKDPRTGKQVHSLKGILLWNLGRMQLAQRLLKKYGLVMNKQELISLIPITEPQNFDELDELDDDEDDDDEEDDDEDDDDDDDEEEEEEEEVVEEVKETNKGKDIETWQLKFKY